MQARTTPPFRVELLRAADLLHLQVEGDNLILVKDAPDGPRLTVDDRQRPAFLRFSFGPQTIAESAFYQAALVNGDTGEPIAQEGNPARPDKDAALKTHEAVAPPGTVSQSAHAAAQAHKPPRQATVAQLGHPSRLVFEVPAGTTIPFSIEGLLDWAKLTLSVHPIAAIGEHPSPAEIAAAPAIRQPTINETSLELPYKLVISPTRDVAWLHHAQPFTTRGRTELWHTRMALRGGAGVVELSHGTPAPLRALWWTDDLPFELPVEDVKGDPDLGRTAMSARDRYQLVVLTCAFHGYTTEFKLTLPNGMELPFTFPYVPQPFRAERLMLSALGGWLHSRGEWPSPPRRAPAALPHRADYAQLYKDVRPLPPRAGALAAPARQLDRGHASVFFPPARDEQLDLSEWVHVATQGRDHYVKIVYEGELWPFRHPAALIKITERKFVEANGIMGAYLLQRMFIVVRKPTMAFGEDDRANPFKSVSLTTLTTPDIVAPAPIFGSHSFWVNVMTPAGAKPFQFHAVALDTAPNTVDFTVPMMFVSKSDLLPSAIGVIAAEYNAKHNAATRACRVPGQKVALALQHPQHDSTVLVTDTINFVMDARFQPGMLKATVEIPQVQALLGTKQPTSVRFYKPYLDLGLADPTNPNGVFAQVVPDSYDEYSEAVAPASLGLSIAAEKAGGIATPNMAITTLSRELGPLAGKIEDAAINKFDPAQFFPRDDATRLFGSFDLLDIFLPRPANPAAMTLDKNAPTMRTERTALADGTPAIVTTLDWQPAFLEPDGEFDILGIAKISKNKPPAVSALKIHATIAAPIVPSKAGATTRFEGELTDFTVSVLESVAINFKRFHFSKASNEKMAVQVQLDPGMPLAFTKDLAFIEEIRNAIPPGLFGDGPSIDLIANPLGIRAGFAFALPPLTVGVFTLKDVKLGAALTLPFLDGKPVFDFNISERPHPFLLAVGIFGGGGFFHLQIDTAGFKALEVALEFGAAAALDIGVASGEVHIMAGIYFSLQRKEGETTLAAILSGYLRMGGSLNVLGLIHISVEFNLSFTYDSDTDKAYGRATLVVSVEVLMFSTSVSLTVERAFGGSGDPHFIDFYPAPEPWRDYALAFA